MDTIEIKSKLEEVNTWLSGEYAAIRTGQATPALLDSIKVESYGALVPLNQVGSIGTEDARTIRISPWDTDSITAIEAALQESDLGVSVATDSAGVRAIFPELTAERREQLQKLAKQKLEEARIRVRGVRDDVMKTLDKLQKDGEASEDETFTKKDAIQGEVETANKSLEDLYQKKESELTA